MARGIRLRTAAGRAALAKGEALTRARELIECALRMIGHLDRRLEPIDDQLTAFARRWPGAPIATSCIVLGVVGSAEG